MCFLPTFAYKLQVEAEAFGDKKKHIGRLLRARVIKSTAPSDMSSRRQTKVANHNLKKSAKPKTRRESLWNAFVAISKGEVTCRVGSAGHKAWQESLREKYRADLDDPARRLRLQVKAAELQAQRESCMNPANSSAAPQEQGFDGLSSSQRKRLGQTKLDSYLAKVHDHPAWNSGLEISSQNWPLKEALILEDNLEDCKAGVDRVFAYDSQIDFNPEPMPAFPSVCHERCGGVCCNSATFASVDACIRQLDGFLAFYDLDRPGTLLRFAVDLDGSSQGVPAPAEFYLLGAVAKKPLLHVLARLEEHPGEIGAFKLAVKGRALDLTTAHRLADKLLSGQASSSNPSSENFPPIGVSVFRQSDYSGAQSNSDDLPNLIRVSELNKPFLQRSLGLLCDPPPKKASKSTALKVPFGLKLAVTLNKNGIVSVRRKISKTQGKPRKRQTSKKLSGSQLPAKNPVGADTDILYDAHDDTTLEPRAQQSKIDAMSVEAEVLSLGPTTWFIQVYFCFRYLSI